MDRIPPINAFTTTLNGAAVDGVDVSGTTVYRGKATDLGGRKDAAMHLEWSGTPNGTFKVRGSGKPKPDPATDTDWVDVALDVAIVQPAGSASKDLVDLSAFPFPWVQPVYTNASSTGRINAWVSAKGK